MQWFRWHNGSVSDPKFRLVAKRAESTVAAVIAVWAFLLESANQSDPRGVCGVPDHDSVECALGLADGESVRIWAALVGAGLVDADGAVTNWDKRQPKRERGGPGDEAWRNRNQSEPTRTTQNQKVPRSDQIRSDESILTKKPTPSPKPGVVYAHGPDLTDLTGLSTAEALDRLGVGEPARSALLACPGLTTPAIAAEWADSCKARSPIACLVKRLGKRFKAAIGDNRQTLGPELNRAMAELEQARRNNRQSIAMETRK